MLYARYDKQLSLGFYLSIGFAIVPPSGCSLLLQASILSRFLPLCLVNRDIVPGDA